MDAIQLVVAMETIVLSLAGSPIMRLDVSVVDIRSAIDVVCPF